MNETASKHYKFMSVLLQQTAVAVLLNKEMYFFNPTSLSPFMKIKGDWVFENAPNNLEAVIF